METPESPKLKFYSTIKGIEARVNAGRTKKIVLDSFITTPTLMAEIRWGSGWETLQDFADKHVLLMRNDSLYIQRMLDIALS